MPGATIIKLIGYTNGNRDYNTAKRSAGKWKNATSLNDEQINRWTSAGGWIGATIPDGRYLYDIDNSVEGELVKDLLENENVNHHAIKTPNGYQYIFKDGEGLTQFQGYINRLGIKSDSRKAGSGYIVFPTDNTEGRYVITQSMAELDKPPHYLNKVWNAQKTPSFSMAYPYEGTGSRNGDFYDLARRLFKCGVHYGDVSDSLRVAYENLVYNKDDFTLIEIKRSIDSAYQKVNEGGENDFQLHVNEDELADSTIFPKPFFQKYGSLYYLKESKKDGEPDQEIFISRHIPILERKFHNVERPQVFYEISWKQGNQKVSEVVSASTIADVKKLIELSDSGLSVTTGNRANLVKFMDYYQLYNNIEEHYAVERLGKVKDKFIHPVLTKDIEIMAADHGEKQLREAFEVKGTAESWNREIFERIKDQPKAVFMVLSSFASVIINDLGVKPFIVESSGGTSQGKTTGLEIASTVHGNKNLVNEWNATPVAIERKAAYLNSFPLFMDDTRKAKKYTLSSIVYQFSGGRSKGRGSVTGSQREYTWQNILLSTGEVSLNDYAENHGGAAARVIPLGDEPLKRDYEMIVDLQQAILDNYGAVGIEFLKVWEAHKDDLIPEFNRVKKLYVKKSGQNNVLNRLAEFYATIHFTGEVVKDYLGLDVKLNDIVKLFDEIKEENKDVDKPMKFLEDILSDLDSKRDNISGSFQAQDPLKAIYKDDQLYLLPAYTKEFLGVEESQTRKEWLKRGITIASENRGKQVDYQKVTIDRKQQRAIPVNMEYVKGLGFNFADDVTA